MRKGHVADAPATSAIAPVQPESAEEADAETAPPDAGDAISPDGDAGADPREASEGAVEDPKSVVGGAEPSSEAAAETGDGDTGAEAPAAANGDKAVEAAAMSVRAEENLVSAALCHML